MNKNVLYRSIPKVDILLADEGIKVLIEAYSRESVMEAIHSEMEKLRAYIGTCDDEEKAKHQIALLNENIAKAVAAMHTPNMKKVINGTGTILHTNLGRHSFVGSETSHERKVDSFVGKISLFDCHIHRSIEDGVCYFI